MSESGREATGDVCPGLGGEHLYDAVGDCVGCGQSGREATCSTPLPGAHMESRCDCDEVALVQVFRANGLNGSVGLAEMAAQCLDALGARGWRHVPGDSTLMYDGTPPAREAT